MRRIFGYCLRFILVSSVAILAVALALSGVVVGIFSTPGSPVYAIALDGFRRFAPAFLFAGVNIFSSALFTALSDGRTSAIISFARTFGFLLLGLLLLPRLLEVDGVWLAVPLAELLSCLLSVWFLRRKRADFGFGGGDLPDTVDAAADGSDGSEAIIKPRRNAPGPLIVLLEGNNALFRILRSSSFW